MLALSSLREHDDLLVEKGRRSRGGADVQKPKSVIDYNIAKKGVDMSDQMSSYYSSLKKTKRWYKKVAIDLITGTIAVNAWLIFNKYYSNKPWSLLQFKESITLSLLTGEPEEKIRCGRRPSSVNKAPQTVHVLAEAPGSKQKAENDVWDVMNLFL